MRAATARACPDPLQERVAAAALSGRSGREIAAAFGISVSGASSGRSAAASLSQWLGSPSCSGTVRISVCGRAVEHYAAMALMKRSPNASPPRCNSDPTPQPMPLTPADRLNTVWPSIPASIPARRLKQTKPRVRVLNPINRSENEPRAELQTRKRRARLLDAHEGLEKQHAQRQDSDDSSSSSTRRFGILIYW